jgi:MFS family permease
VSRRAPVARVVAASLVGTAVEWYDFSLYGSAALVFGRLFFPHADPVAGTMAAFATFAIGLLPTYQSAGALAPVLLVALRFVQGLGVGGEWAGAVLMVAERGDPRWRGFSASWVQAGAPVGMLLSVGAFGAASRLPEDEFLAWGWRAPFLLGIVLTGVGLFLRVKVLESPLFARAVEEAPPDRLPLVEVLRRPLTDFGAGGRR